MKTHDTKNTLQLIALGAGLSLVASYQLWLPTLTQYYGGWEKLAIVAWIFMIAVHKVTVTHRDESGLHKLLYWLPSAVLLVCPYLVFPKIYYAAFGIYFVFQVLFSKKSREIRSKCRANAALRVFT